jgi:hypothetical protein
VSGNHLKLQPTPSADLNDPLVRRPTNRAFSLANIYAIELVHPSKIRQLLPGMSLHSIHLHPPRYRYRNLGSSPFRTWYLLLFIQLVLCIQHRRSRPWVYSPRSPRYKIRQTANLPLLRFRTIRLRNLAGESTEDMGIDRCERAARGGGEHQ